MLSIVSGMVVTGAGGTALWACLPRGGKVHAITQTPLLDSLIPISIVSSLAIGLALIVSGIIAMG